MNYYYIVSSDQFWVGDNLAPHKDLWLSDYCYAKRYTSLASAKRVLKLLQERYSMFELRIIKK